jgi:hypothetical protein
MPSFNNYIFTDIQYTIPEGSNVSILYPTVQITIVPNSGYTANAADFSLDSSFSDDAVQSVVFTQDGLNVLCTVTFDTGFFMPSGNYTIPLCVVGEGEVGEITIGGTISANVGPNIIGSPNEGGGTPYFNSGLVGENELLLTRSYTAASGYYLTSTGLQVTNGNASNYNIVQTPVYDLDNNLTSISYDVNYIYPNQSISGDRLSIYQVSAREIFVAPQYVTSYSSLPSTVSGFGGQFITNWQIFGGEGASVTAIMTDTSGGSWTLINNQTIDSTGILTVPVVEFPDIYGSCNGYCSEEYTITLSGDLDPNFAQPNPIIIYQTTVSPRIALTATSSYGVTGYNLVETEGSAYTVLSSPQTIPVEWILSVPSGALSLPSLSIDYDQIVLENNQAAYPSATSDQSNVNNINVDSTLGILPGDTFNGSLITGSYQTPTGNNTSLNANLYSPFDYTVTAVNSSTNISVAPNISIKEDFRLTIVRNGGNVVNLSNISLTQVDSTTVKLNATLNVDAFGYEDKTFTLNLDEVLEFTPDLACGSTAISGGEGITDYSLDLDPTGGLVAFLVNGQGLPDKFEILHGGASGDKKATSGMVASENAGPFDNAFGTSPLNAIPTSSQLNADQFIGSNKYAPLPFAPSRTSEFNSDTGFTIPSMTVGGTTYQQVVWWQYTAADYTKNPNATLRITGPSGTGWDALRLCCPDGNCT